MSAPKYQIMFAGDNLAALEAAQALRYDVFVREMGGSGDLVDHERGLECDQFDPYFEHLLLLDLSRGPDLRSQTVGVYRLLTQANAERIGQFYSEDEYDLAALRRSGRKLLELGRSCLAKEYRGGTAMFHLWSALAQYVAQEEVEVLFGVASFHGTDTEQLAAPLSLLHHRHLAPEELRTRVKSPGLDMNLIAEADLDRPAAMVQVPSLIKAYLRLGGFVGQGAFIDHAFQTTDVCLILDRARMNEKQSRLYSSGKMA